MCTGGEGKIGVPITMETPVKQIERVYNDKRCVYSKLKRLVCGCPVISIGRGWYVAVQ
jgi:hypothetical protein